MVGLGVGGGPYAIVGCGVGGGTYPMVGLCVGGWYTGGWVGG